MFCYSTFGIEFVRSGQAQCRNRCYDLPEAEIYNRLLAWHSAFVGAPKDSPHPDFILQLSLFLPAHKGEGWQIFECVARPGPR
jgi:hypothetical protein